MMEKVVDKWEYQGGIEGVWVVLGMRGKEWYYGFDSFDRVVIKRGIGLRGLGL